MPLCDSTTSGTLLLYAVWPPRAASQSIFSAIASGRPRKKQRRGDWQDPAPANAPRRPHADACGWPRARQPRAPPTFNRQVAGLPEPVDDGRQHVGRCRRAYLTRAGAAFGYPSQENTRGFLCRMARPRGDFRRRRSRRSSHPPPRLRRRRDRSCPPRYRPRARFRLPQPPYRPRRDG